MTDTTPTPSKTSKTGRARRILRGALSTLVVAFAGLLIFARVALKPKVYDVVSVDGATDKNRGLLRMSDR